jgi:type I restriction enzyme R subunit
VLDVLSFPEEELRELEASHAAIMALLKTKGLTQLTDYDAFFDAFYDEDLRFDFISLFKQFTKNLNLVFPAKEALGHMADYQALTAIKEMAAKHFRDNRLSMKGVPPKLRAITDAFLESKGIDVKVPPISILDEDFQKEVKKHDRTKTMAAEIEHAIRHHLEVELTDDPEVRRLRLQRRWPRSWRSSPTTGGRFMRSWKSSVSASSTRAMSRPTACT